MKVDTGLSLSLSLPLSLPLSLSLWPEMLSCGRVQDTAATQTMIWSAASERISPETFSYFSPKKSNIFPRRSTQIQACLVISCLSNLKPWNESIWMQRSCLTGNILWKGKILGAAFWWRANCNKLFSRKWNPSRHCCCLLSGEFYLEADATAKSNHYPIISDQNRNSSWTLWHFRNWESSRRD